MKLEKLADYISLTEPVYIDVYRKDVDGHYVYDDNNSTVLDGKPFMDLPKKYYDYEILQIGAYGDEFSQEYLWIALQEKGS